MFLFSLFCLHPLRTMNVMFGWILIDIGDSPELSCTIEPERIQKDSSITSIYGKISAKLIQFSKKPHVYHSVGSPVTRMAFIPNMAYHVRTPRNISVCFCA